MTVVLDASAAAEIAKRSARGVDFVNMLLRSDMVMAPDIYIAEISNVMWKLWLMDKKNSGLYRTMAADCMEYVDEYVAAADIWREAVIEAQTHMHSVYDMLYVVLAKRNDAKLLTSDLKLRGVCAKLGVRYYDGLAAELGADRAVSI
ncbi:MAG: type II toxin-antitoxin system VapC family toxin [Clostridiales Family XIII bacterium]|jgi:predicted nucleic acid-binding protein|nr:type II toxin-antitoxin system VapC family toxin [Clostridiales Family XIII bacterium]